MFSPDGRRFARLLRNVEGNRILIVREVSIDIDVGPGGASGLLLPAWASLFVT